MEVDGWEIPLVEGCEETCGDTCDEACEATCEEIVEVECQDGDRVEEAWFGAACDDLTGVEGDEDGVPDDCDTSPEAPNPDQKTSDIRAVIQEIVDRPGWSTGNSLAILVTGTGTRTAESFDRTPSAAPLLHVLYQAP